MIGNFRGILIQGLWDRLARTARGPASQRTFVIEELTHVLSCTEWSENK